MYTGLVLSSFNSRRPSDKTKSQESSHPKSILKSDEAGCYHNSSLIAAVRDIAKRVGVTVHSYHYSEPQSGKDICDRILCPLKSSIRMYCNEGHDVLTAVDMRDALIQHPGKGTSATVCVVNESRKTLSVKKMEQFSSFHNFEYEADGLRVWKCYGIGDGKYIPYALCHQSGSNRSPNSGIPRILCTTWKTRGKTQFRS